MVKEEESKEAWNRGEVNKKTMEGTYIKGKTYKNIDKIGVESKVHWGEGKENDDKVQKVGDNVKERWSSQRHGTEEENIRMMTESGDKGRSSIERMDSKAATDEVREASLIKMEWK